MQEGEEGQEEHGSHSVQTGWDGEYNMCERLMTGKWRAVVNPFYTINAAVRLGPIIPYTHRCVFKCLSTRATINFLVLPFLKEKKKKITHGALRGILPTSCRMGTPF